MIKQLKQLEFNFNNNDTCMSGWLCDECLSNDIISLNDLTPVHNSDMDIYCNECKCEQYKVSTIHINCKNNSSLLSLNN